MTYTIGETAKRFGISAHTLRYYDKEGLLPYVGRSASGVRQFGEEDFEWLNLIECLKRSGLSIKEIKQYADWCMEGDETIEQRRELFYARREATIKEMEQLQDTLDMLTYKCWFYDVAAQKGTTEAPHTMSYEEMPKEIAQLSLRLNKQHPKIKALDEAS